MGLMRYLSVVGLVLFGWVLYTSNVGKTVGILASANPWFVLLGVLFVVFEVLVRSVGWKALVNIWSKKYSLADSAQTYMIGIAFGAVTPAKAGDFIKVGDLSGKTKLKLMKSFTIGLLDRLINFIFLFLSACAGAVAVGMFLTGFSSQFDVLILLLAASIIALVAALNERVSLLVLRPLQMFLVPARFRGNAKELFRTFHETVAEFKLSGLRWVVLALTLVSWAVIFVRPYFFARAVGMRVDWWVFLVFIPLISVVEVLPISIMGLGTRDASILFLFGIMGVERERMVALSALIVLLSLVPQVVAGYLIAWTHKVRVP